MVRVSRNRLGQKELDKLFDQLNHTVGKLSQRQSEQFLTDLLGQEEKIVLAKRLAAIVMLTEGQSLYKVSETLKISTSTARNFQLKLQTGRYQRLLSVIQKNKIHYLELLDTLDSILHLGGILPHYGQSHRSEAFKRSQKPFD